MGNDYIQQPNTQTYYCIKNYNKNKNKEEIVWLHPRGVP